MEPIPLTGYASRFSVSAGERIEFKVSSYSAQPFEARLVRVISCDPNPAGPGVVEHDVPSALDGRYPSRVQSVRRGSHMTAAAAGLFASLEDFTVSALAWSTTPEAGVQGLFSNLGPDLRTGFALAVTPTGAAVVSGDLTVSTGKPMVARRWYRVWLAYDAGRREVQIGQQPLVPSIDADDEAVLTHPLSIVAGGDEIVVAALRSTQAQGHYNGKIEAPCIWSRSLRANEIAGASTDEAMVAWDFARDMHGKVVTDTGPRALHGELSNLPARAMKGSRWDGSVMAWTSAPEHYAAIHFHDDDLYDCEWESDMALEVPADLRSGVYAVRLRTQEGGVDMIPFFVTAPLGKPQSRIAVLVPTFTYTVYANIARGNNTESLKRTVQAWNASPWNADEHQEFGLSTYNLHSDGSGIAYSSRRRPIITMRSSVVCYPDVPGSGLRHFAADGHLWYWLWKLGYDFDVVTDDELHRDGVAAIEGYDVVMTCSHPEYHTRESLDALAAYTQGGGRFMYLGGNGFYWKVAVNQSWPDAVEIRRGEGGIRAWAAEPGEYYNAFDGLYGGLWRRNGRAPQQLCGVGFTSQGAHKGEPYVRTEASRAPEFAWIFDGVDGDVLGDFGFSGGGAAGFELDRADVRLGTPLNAVVLASSPGEAEHFVLVPEDILTNVLSWNGEDFPDLVRADMVLFETAAGGAVFSVGSITYCGSLPFGDCDNNISRLTRNVLDGFLSRRPALLDRG